MSTDNVTIRGTVSPATARVQIQGVPAPVGNGVFAGNASLHSGTNTIDIIASAPGDTPDATTITLTRQSSPGSAPGGGGNTQTTKPTGSTSSQPTGQQPDGLVAQFGAFRELPNAQSLAARLNAQGITTEIIDSNDYATSPAAPLGLWLVVSEPFSSWSAAQADANSSGITGAFVRRVTPLN